MLLLWMDAFAFCLECFVPVSTLVLVLDWITSELQTVRRVNLLIELSFPYSVPWSMDVVDRIRVTY